MKRKKYGLILTLVLFTISKNIYGVVPSDTLIYGLLGSQMFDASKFEKSHVSGSYMPKYLGKKGKPILFIRTEPQYGLTLRPTLEESNVIGLPVAKNLWIEETEGQNNLLQIGENDFDGDLINEIVIAYGIRGIGIKCIVLKYLETNNSTDIDIDKKFKVIGEFEYGYHDPRFVSFVEKNNISFPIGSQGVSDGFVFVKGKFIPVIHKD